MPRKSLLSFSKSEGVKDIKITQERNNRAQNAVGSAFNNLSIRCENNTQDGAHYDARKVLILLSGPKDEVTHETLEIAESACVQRVPGSSRRKGTYPGRTSEKISVTIILSGIGKGKGQELMDFFFERANESTSEVERRKQERVDLRKNTRKLVKGLPKLS